MAVIRRRRRRLCVCLSVHRFVLACPDQSGRPPIELKALSVPMIPLGAIHEGRPHREGGSKKPKNLRTYLMEAPLSENFPTNVARCLSLVSLSHLTHCLMALLMHDLEAVRCSPLIEMSRIDISFHIGLGMPSGNILSTPIM